MAYPGYGLYKTVQRAAKRKTRASITRARREEGAHLVSSVDVVALRAKVAEAFDMKMEGFESSNSAVGSLLNSFKELAHTSST